MKTEKTVEQYRKELIEFFSTAQEVINSNQKNKNMAMWQLLNEQKIVPLSKTLWMATSSARSENL